MSNIMTAMSLLIETFCKYAGKGGNIHTLSNAELKELLENEFGDLLVKANDKTGVDRIFKELDANQDNSVDFAEFGKLIFSLTVMCHEHFTRTKK